VPPEKYSTLLILLLQESQIRHIKTILLELFEDLIKDAATIVYKANKNPKEPALVVAHLKRFAINSIKGNFASTHKMNGRKTYKFARLVDGI